MSKELLKKTSTVSSMTLLSRVFGFVRDVVLASVFGASASADAFFVAFKIPNFFRRLFAEGAFNQAFIPVLNEYKATASHEEVKSFINNTYSALLCVLLLFVIFGMLFSPLVITLFAPGFVAEGAKYQLAFEMLRITFPYLVFISLAALSSGVLNSYGVFGPPAFTPIFLNLSLIASAWLFTSQFAEPILALAWGVLMAGVLQWGFQLIFLKRIKLLPSLAFNWRHPGVKKTLTLMAPAIIGVSVVQINLLVDTLIASFLVDGSIAWLYYSDRLLEFPLGVLGIALATVVLPKLSEQFSSGAPDGYAKTLGWGLQMAVLLGLPAMIGLLMLSGPILTTLFNYGAFTQYDVLQAKDSLLAYAAGLQAFMIIKIFSSAFFARQDTKTPVKIAVICMITNILLNLLFVSSLAHAGLALATTCSGWLNCILLYRALPNRQTKGFLSVVAWGPIVFSSLMMGGVIWLLTPEHARWFGWAGSQRAIYLSAIILGAVVVYFVSLRIMGARLTRFANQQA